MQKDPYLAFPKHIQCLGGNIVNEDPEKGIIII